MTSTFLRFEAHRIDEPVVEQLLDRYLAELTGHIPGFDPALAAPPEAADFEPPGGLFLVGFAKDVPLAIGGVRRFAEGTGEIRRMWVAPVARGRGYARLLLAALEEAARAAGYREVLLDTHGSLDAALALYRSSGYRERERYNDNAFAEHFFAKRLE
ncbi:MAG TPA: GNAT family N-acetyltransferase [Acidimicrobiales bacterium]|nr:GNAT family N-acetyltransferase [Acidimicrobiales bacterium]